MKLSPVTLGRRIVAEMWLYPDGTRIVELSTKCLPGEGLDVALEMRDFLASKGIDMQGEQQTKTKTALEFFSAELRGGAPDQASAKEIAKATAKPKVTKRPTRRPASS